MKDRGVSPLIDPGELFILPFHRLIVPAMLRQVAAVPPPIDISRGLFRRACRCWRRLRPLSDATLEVLQVLPHLLQRKPEGEKSLRDIAGPAADQTFAAQRHELRRITL